MLFPTKYGITKSTNSAMHLSLVFFLLLKLSP